MEFQNTFLKSCFKLLFWILVSHKSSFSSKKKQATATATTMSGLELLLYYYIFEDDDSDDDDSKPNLSLEERRRRSKKIPRIALKKYSQSAWRYMFDSKNNQALINCCGVDHEVFSKLIEVFEPVFNTYTIDRKSGLIRKLKPSAMGTGTRTGRRRKVDAIGVLGLVLFWFRTRGSAARAISLAFGLTSSCMYDWLRFGRRTLLYALQFHPDAQVKPPTGAEINRYVEAVANRYPLLGDERVWAAMDGLKLPLQQSGNWLKQNQYYNGWKSHTFVNSVFCFAPDGLIRCATINCPGSWHDSTLADYGIYQKLENLYNEHGAKVVVDSAFGLQARGFLIKSAQQQDPARRGATQAEARRELTLNGQATSLRQLSEHGMRMIQGQFPRLKDNFPFEEFGERKIVLHLMVLLYNFQASRVGINQILNTFMSKTEGFYSYSIAPTANEEFV
jgi:hypothetical protein